MRVRGYRVLHSVTGRYGVLTRLRFALCRDVLARAGAEKHIALVLYETMQNVPPVYDQRRHLPDKTNPRWRKAAAGAAERLAQVPA